MSKAVYHRDGGGPCRLTYVRWKHVAGAKSAGPVRSRKIDAAYFRDPAGFCAACRLVPSRYDIGVSDHIVDYMPVVVVGLSSKRSNTNQFPEFYRIGGLDI